MEFIRIGKRKKLLERHELDELLAADGFPVIGEWEPISESLKIKQRNYLNSFSTRRRHGNDLICALLHGSGKVEATMVRGFFADQKTETRS